jgi:hypothetical protein
MDTKGKGDQARWQSQSAAMGMGQRCVRETSAAGIGWMRVRRRVRRVVAVPLAGGEVARPARGARGRYPGRRREGVVVRGGPDGYEWWVCAGWVTKTLRFLQKTLPKLLFLWSFHFFGHHAI